jgi:hypothetical protein
VVVVVKSWFVWFGSEEVWNKKNIASNRGKMRGIKYPDPYTPDVRINLLQGLDAAG